MTPGFYLVWTQGLATLVGEVNGVFVQSEAVQGISFPNTQTAPINVRVSSSARQNSTFDTLRQVRFYLTGDPGQLATVQGLWPTQGGGLQISFDGGRTYNTFSTVYGYEADPATWVLLPAESIGLNGSNGVLGAFDSANILLRYMIPELATQYQVYDIALTADFDVS
jgi:hypothetical protein